MMMVLLNDRAGHVRNPWGCSQPVKKVPHKETTMREDKDVNGRRTNT